MPKYKVTVQFSDSWEAESLSQFQMQLNELLSDIRKEFLLEDIKPILIEPLDD